jgi:hypothetical protein
VQVAEPVAQHTQDARQQLLALMKQQQPALYTTLHQGSELDDRVCRQQLLVQHHEETARQLVAQKASQSARSIDAAKIMGNDSVLTGLDSADSEQISAALREQASLLRERELLERERTELEMQREKERKAAEALERRCVAAELQDQKKIGEREAEAHAQISQQWPQLRLDFEQELEAMAATWEAEEQQEQQLAQTYRERRAQRINSSVKGEKPATLLPTSASCAGMQAAGDPCRKMESTGQHSKEQQWPKEQSGNCGFISPRLLCMEVEQQSLRDRERHARLAEARQIVQANAKISMIDVGDQDHTHDRTEREEQERLEEQQWIDLDAKEQARQREAKEDEERIRRMENLRLQWEKEEQEAQDPEHGNESAGDGSDGHDGGATDLAAALLGQWMESSIATYVRREITEHPPTDIEPHNRASELSTDIEPRKPKAEQRQGPESTMTLGMKLNAASHQVLTGSALPQEVADEERELDRPKLAANESAGDNGHQSETPNAMNEVPLHAVSVTAKVVSCDVGTKQQAMPQHVAKKAEIDWKQDEEKRVHRWAEESLRNALGVNFVEKRTKEIALQGPAQIVSNVPVASGEQRAGVEPLSAVSRSMPCTPKEKRRRTPGTTPRTPPQLPPVVQRGGFCLPSQPLPQTALLTENLPAAHRERLSKMDEQEAMRLRKVRGLAKPVSGSNDARKSGSGSVDASNQGAAKDWDLIRSMMPRASLYAKLSQPKWKN